MHVIDAAAADPVEQFETIDRELAAYGAGLDELPQVVVLNKIDLLPEPPGLGLEDERILRVFRLSCATGEGVEAFRRALFELCPPAPPEPEAVDDELADFLVYRPRPSTRPFRILRTDRGFRVVGAPPSEEELERALVAAGVKKGAEVEIAGEAHEWV